MLKQRNDQGLDNGLVFSIKIELTMLKFAGLAPYGVTVGLKLRHLFLRNIVQVVGTAVSNPTVITRTRTF
jgi:hypothetical protein